MYNILNVYQVLCTVDNTILKNKQCVIVRAFSPSPLEGGSQLPRGTLCPLSLAEISGRYGFTQ